MRSGAFAGASVFLSRSLVPPEAYDSVHDVLRLNGAQVFLCCDPSRAAPSDFHVISSPDHEKFEYLRSKGCNLVGPQCVHFCAKEHRTLPKQGYTCCLAMDGVKVLASGFEMDEKGKIEQLVTAMGGTLLTKASLDADFVVVQNVLAAKYKWALNVLKKPIVNITWLYRCWAEHRIVPQEPYRIPPFCGLTICVTKIPADERKEMEKLIVENGGHYSADLTRKCTHLVSESPGGDKYMVARKWGHIHIITRKWVHQSIARRACMEEGFYAVPEVSASRNTTKASQKEYHNEVQTSASVLHTDFEDLETMPQNMSTFSNDTKIKSENTDEPIPQKSNEGKLDHHVAEDSETEDNDLYLADCRILLLGFNEKELAKLVNIIRNGGGSRHMLLSEKLTHIVLGNLSEIEKKEVRRLAAWGVINIVKATWLEECDQSKREVPVSSRHNASDLLLAKGSACNSMEPPADISSNKKGKTFPGISPVPVGSLSLDKDMDTGTLSKKTKGGEKCGNGPKLATAAEQSDLLYSLKSVRDNRLKQQLNIDTAEAKNSSSDIFKGQFFCFSNSFPNDRRAEIIEWVGQGGGVMVDDQGRKNVHFIIGCHGSIQLSSIECQSTFVSPHWIRFCLEEGCMQDVGSHILFSPLNCKIPFPGFERLRFCISQYECRDRMLLRNLCHTLGAKFTEKLSKKVTHLLCKFKDGSKYDAACKWGIQSITAEWVTECIKQDMMLPLDPFRPKTVTTQDREAGLCTVSQYPTQAALIVSGNASQWLSQSQGPMECGMADAGLEHPSSFIKRPRLSNSDGTDDSLKKNRNADELMDACNAVPDVADAIEDLLAQSNKMQDMRSPGQSVCEQSTFSHQHSVGVEDHPTPSTTSFEVPIILVKSTSKQDSHPSPFGRNGNNATYYAFSETQTESQVVGYEEDLTGRQKIIDRVRSQSTATTPDK